MTATRQEKYDCAKREVRQRRKVFPRLIEQGKMSAEFAARQIEIMEAIAKDYEEPPSQGDMLARPDPLSQALNEGDGVYRP